MNISGSDVSKEAADMILLGASFQVNIWYECLKQELDDNFASTVSK